MRTNLEEAYENFADRRLAVVRPDISKTSYSRHTKMTMDLFDGYELENAFELGANWQKEQMLNDGIECTIDDDIDMLFADYTNFDEDGYIREQGLKPGDKVKVIMIKVEE